MKEAYRMIRLRKKALDLIQICNGVITQFQSMKLRMTLRQLYYQLVKANYLPNTEKSYRLLSSVLSDGRLAGLVDWDAIEDRIRKPGTPLEFEDLDELVHNMKHWYRLPRWKNQDAYVELWVEKDAIAGVLQPITKENHVTLMVNRGYSSQSAMYESAQRFRVNANAGNKYAVLLYLGDHDPSGEDMVRDVRERLEMFGVVDLTVKKIGLTTAQVKQYNPPPNPAKVTDPRASAYIAQHGNSSWEVDALPPNVLTALVQKEIGKYLDRAKYDLVKIEEERHKDALVQATKYLTKRLAKGNP